MDEQTNSRRQIGVIGGLRIYGALTMLFMICWILSDAELNFIDMTLVPMLCYVTSESYLTKKITILVVPLLFNIALWIKTYKSYLIVKSILLLELTRLLIMISLYVIFGPLAGVLGRGTIPVNAMIGFLLFLVSFIYLKNAFKNVKKTGYMESILEKQKRKEEEIEIDIMKTLMTIIGVFCIMISAEIIIQNRTYDRKVETYKLSDGMYCKNISSDGNKFIMVTRRNGADGRDRENVYIYDYLKQEKLKKVLTDMYIGRSYYFTPDSKNVIYKKDSRDEGTIRFAMVNAETGEINHRFDKSVQSLSDGGHLIRESPFSLDGKYFAVSDLDHIQIWNYNTGNLSLIAQNQIGNIEWISGEKLIVESGKNKDEIYLYKINKNEELNYDKKEKIAESISEKRQEMRGAKVWFKNLGDGNKMAIVVSGNTTTLYKSRTYIEIWDVESEEKLVSNIYYNLIEKVIFDQKNKILITFDELRQNRNKIRFFNTDNGVWEKKFLLLNPEVGWTPVMYKDGIGILFKGEGYGVLHLE